MGSRFKRFKRISKDRVKPQAGEEDELNLDTLNGPRTSITDPKKVHELPPDIQSQLFVPSMFDADHILVDGEVRRRPEACSTRCKLCLIGGIGFIIILAAVITTIAFVMHRDRLINGEASGRAQGGTVLLQKPVCFYTDYQCSSCPAGGSTGPRGPPRNKVNLVDPLTRCPPKRDAVPFFPGGWCSQLLIFLILFVLLGLLGLLLFSLLSLGQGSRPKSGFGLGTSSGSQDSQGTSGSSGPGSDDSPTRQGRALAGGAGMGGPVSGVFGGGTQAGIPVNEDPNNRGGGGWSLWGGGGSNNGRVGNDAQAGPGGGGSGGSRGGGGASSGEGEPGPGGAAGDGKGGWSWGWGGDGSKGKSDGLRATKEGATPNREQGSDGTSHQPKPTGGWLWGSGGSDKKTGQDESSEKSPGPTGWGWNEGNKGGTGNGGVGSGGPGSGGVGSGGPGSGVVGSGGPGSGGVGSGGPGSGGSANQNEANKKGGGWSWGFGGKGNDNSAQSPPNSGSPQDNQPGKDGGWSWGLGGGKPEGQGTPPTNQDMYKSSDSSPSSDQRTGQGGGWSWGFGSSGNDKGGQDGTRTDGAYGGDKNPGGSRRRDAGGTLADGPTKDAQTDRNGWSWGWGGGDKAKEASNQGISIDDGGQVRPCESCASGWDGRSNSELRNEDGTGRGGVNGGPGSGGVNGGRGDGCANGEPGSGGVNGGPGSGANGGAGSGGVNGGTGSGGNKDKESGWSWGWGGDGVKHGNQNGGNQGSGSTGEGSTQRPQDALGEKPQGSWSLWGGSPDEKSAKQSSSGVGDSLKYGGAAGSAAIVGSQIGDKTSELGGGSYIGLPNFANCNNGAFIFRVHNWPPFRGDECSKGTHIIIEPLPLEKDRFWRFNPPGDTEIQLSESVQVTGLTLHHSPFAADLSTAPKDFEIFGCDYNQNYERQEHFFGRFSYSDASQSRQSFSVQYPSDKKFSVVRLRFHNNHGHPEFVDVYRVEVHGS